MLILSNSFSARVSKILHFYLNPESSYNINIPQYKAIIEWVEGSEIISSFDHLFDEKKIRELIEIPNVDGVLSRYSDMLDFVHRLEPDLSLYQYLSWLLDVPDQLYYNVFSHL